MHISSLSRASAREPYPSLQIVAFRCIGDCLEVHVLNAHFFFIPSVSEGTLSFTADRGIQVHRRLSGSTCLKCTFLLYPERQRGNPILHCRSWHSGASAIVWKYMS